MTFDRAMMRALRADAEKLEHLTGEDHAPEFLADCEACGGEGAIDTPCPRSDDPDFCIRSSCPVCNGVGFFIVDAVGDMPVVPEDDCPGHVASAADPKVCGLCGVHIDSLRPPEGNEP